MAYSVEITDLGVEELKSIKAFDRRRIVDEIRAQLTTEPMVETRNRTRLDALIPEFEHVPPLWELRVGYYRVFYDVDETTQMVFVRAVRRKGPGRTTQEIIHD